MLSLITSFSRAPIENDRANEVEVLEKYQCRLTQAEGDKLGRANVIRGSGCLKSEFFPMEHT